MLIGGALANALAFTGSSYLFHRLSADNIDAERKRHDAAIEALQKAQIEWAHKRQGRIDFINNQLRLERKAETKFTELNEAMREYHEVFGHELSGALQPLPREPVLSDFYNPANVHDSQNGEFYFRTVFHFRTNHEAAGSRTGSGAFRHVPLNWFLPENHCFLDVHFLQNCH